MVAYPHISSSDDGPGYPPLSKYWSCDVVMEYICIAIGLSLQSGWCSLPKVDVCVAFSCGLRGSSSCSMPRECTHATCGCGVYGVWGCYLPIYACDVIVGFGL